MSTAHSSADNSSNTGEPDPIGQEKERSRSPSSPIPPALPSLFITSITLGKGEPFSQDYFFTFAAPTLSTKEGLDTICKQPPTILIKLY
ncbi:hypothetical protein V6N13_041222 [Hibiscus sabdariffa]